MRVLHVDTGREWRGGQAQLLHLLRAHPDGAVVALPGDAPIRPEIERLGIPTCPLSQIRAHAGRVDVVAAHTSRAHTLALLAGVRPIVHRRVDFPPRTPLKYRLARGFVAVSAAVATVLRRAGVAPDRVAVVRDGVPRTARSRGPHPELGEGPIVGAVGALVPHKGHRVLVDALAEVPCRAVLVGEGPLRETLHRQIRARGLADRVRLLGHRRDALDLLAGFDVLAHPSLEEGLGQVLIEAIGLGVPVVASCAGGIPEVVRDGVTGRLVPPGDPAALAAALRGVLREPPPGDPASGDAFSVDRMVAGTFAAYRRFGATRGAHPAT